MTEQKPKLFHVDDEESILKLMKRLLSDDFEIKQASNLEDALSIIQKDNFDIYISDGSYPSKGGNSWKEFYDNLIKIKPDANFILYSGDMDLLKEAESLKIKYIGKLDKSPLDLAGHIKKSFQHAL